MWTYHPDLLERPVPRYTSYPTAAEFHDGVGADAMARQLQAVPGDASLSLYVHIPYCREICWYCGCNTGAANKTHRLESYLAALEAEIMMVGQHLNGRGIVRHIAFGGGSPNAIAPVDFVRLIDRVTTMLPLDRPGISVELDPRIFTAQWAALLASCGVTRVSLGVQSLSPDIQQAIGRIQPLGMIESCVADLQRVGIHAVNFDLMYGLPTQTLDDLAETIRETVRLRPSRIALFGYAHLPTLIPRQRRIDGSALPDAAARFAMAQLGYDMLVEAGYRAIGFDHFALADDPLALAADAGTLHRNFQGFTEDDNPILIGMGASAISCFPDAILQNEKNPGRYRMITSMSRLPATRGVMRSVEDGLRAGLIERILCDGRSGTVPAHLQHQARIDLAPYCAQGLAEWVDGEVRLKQGAQPYARVVASIFDQYRAQTQGQFSNAI